MQQMHALLRNVMENGVDRPDRTGTGTRSVFGAQQRFDLRQGFPLEAAKFVPFKLIATELLWFLKGNPDIAYLHEHENHIWDEWAKDDGTFGPIYGKQWRSWPTALPVDPDRGIHAGGIDQIAIVIDQLLTNPDSRRMLVSAWNVSDVESGDMALPPCHVLFQFYSAPMTSNQRLEWLDWNAGGRESLDLRGVQDDDHLHAVLSEAGAPSRALSCQLYQRSADLFLGGYFNVPSYALLTQMIAQVTGHAVGDLVWSIGDAHIYHNHFDQVSELLERPDDLPLPRLRMDTGVTEIDDFKIDHFSIEGYQPMATIKAPVAV
ncbi:MULTISPECIES: thymidylate synthase [unclassified Thioalkalivibrio]|uniref:thymidylate synthase n=1 Tax=unclassified Thioalkalivibrio TaxID=2621013 RepID=UPI0003687A43|nr:MULTISPECIES: thymidylate synthase [unclassified Thioalkalivibrio]